MATPIGDAVVKVKIDTTEAEASLDRMDQGRRQGGSEDRSMRPPGDQDGERDGGGRVPGIAPRRRPRTRPATRATRGRRGISPPGALPLVGGVIAAGVLAAEFGPAVAQFTATLTNRILDDLTGNETVKAAIRAIMKFLVDQTQESAEKIAKLETIVTAAWGTKSDVTQMAKTAFLFNGTVPADDLLAFLSGSFNIRRTLGLGRWAERNVTRQSIGKGLGNAIADLANTQE